MGTPGDFPFEIRNGVAIITGEQIVGYYNLILPVVAFDISIFEGCEISDNEFRHLSCPFVIKRLLDDSLDLSPEKVEAIMSNNPPSAQGFATFSFKKYTYGWKCNRPSTNFGLIKGSVAPDGLELWQVVDFICGLLAKGEFGKSFYSGSE